jgi:ubiquinone biosynthesis protein
MILDDNVVGYLDFGITGLMSAYSQQHLLAMTLALARGDVETMKNEYLWITAHDEDSDLEALRRGIDALSTGWYDSSGKQLKTNITQVFNEILALSRRSGFLPERDIVKFIRSAIAIDGLLTRFDSSFDIGQHIADYCTQYLAEQARRRWLSADRLQDLSSVGAQLFMGAPDLGGEILRRLGLGAGAPMARKPGVETFSDDAGSGAECLALAAVLCALVGLVTVLQQPAPLGVNLWTAELLFAFAAAGRLVLLWRRLPAAGQGGWV